MYGHSHTVDGWFIASNSAIRLGPQFLAIFWHGIKLITVSYDISISLFQLEFKLCVAPVKKSLSRCNGGVKC